MTIRVLVADDQEMVRAGFRMILDDADDIEVVAEAADGARDEFGDPVEVGEVGLQGQDAAGTHGFQFGGQRLHVGRRAAVMQGQVVAGAVQVAGDGRAKTAGSAGDQGDRAGRRGHGSSVDGRPAR